MIDISIQKKIRLILIVSFFSVPVVEARAFWGAKYEPPDGHVYHCAQAEVRPASFTKLEVDWQGVDDYTAACNHRPKLIMHYITFDAVGFALLKSSIEKMVYEKYEYMLQIGLDYYSYFPRYSILNPRDITKEIAEGEYDGKIRELARLFIGIKSPIFLRPGYEFGGNGQGQYASKEHWVKAWKRIHSVFRDEGVQNVVECPPPVRQLRLG